MTTPLSHVLADARYAWYGPSLLIATARGECNDSHPLSGYYFREARHLSVLRLEVNGGAPWLCSDGITSQHQLDFVYVYPEMTQFGGGGTDVGQDASTRDEHGVTQRSVDIRIRERLRFDGVDVTLILANRSAFTTDLEIAWIVDADFADIQEAFASARQQEAPVEREPMEHGLRFRYRHPKLDLSTAVRATGASEWSVADNRLVTRVQLGARTNLETSLAITALDGTPMTDSQGDARRVRRHQLWRAAFTAIEIPRNGVVERIVRNAVSDVAALPLMEGEEDEWLTPQAGIPYYPALFGRDALTAGWQAAMLDAGTLTDAALTRVGRMQSDHVDNWRDAQPGRLPLQIRTGPLARLDLSPFGAYYADQASPFMYIIALGHAFAWSGRMALLTRHWDTARRILDWARDYGDADGDGYLEYHTRSTVGTKNQGWKDSGNAIVYEDGLTVPAPLGTCELQGYWFAAQQIMAALNWVLDKRDDALALWESSLALKRQFNRDWWMEDEGFFALALDAEKRLVRSISSNVGHCLGTGVIDDEHVPRVVERLFAPDMYSGWGVRTLSATHPSYNPLSYHLGSVWPVENATIAFGLRRYGFDDRAVMLAGGLFDLGQLYDFGRIPECVGGYARTEFPQPGAYPRANPLQLWNQTAYVLLVHTLLGLQPVAPWHTLVVDPVLPDWLPEITLRNLRVGDARATITFTRDDEGRSRADIDEIEGKLRLLHQPPAQSLHATVSDRLAAILRSVR
ncbi:MAG: glycogen debranching N-terminal domain-containing protein [Gemmatimonadaceae bacterium]